MAQQLTCHMRSQHPTARSLQAWLLFPFQLPARQQAMAHRLGFLPPRGRPTRTEFWAPGFGLDLSLAVVRGKVDTISLSAFQMKTKKFPKIITFKSQFQRKHLELVPSWLTRGQVNSRLRTAAPTTAMKLASRGEDVTSRPSDTAPRPLPRPPC